MKFQFTSRLANRFKSLIYMGIVAISTLSAGAFPIVTNVVETGGDAELTDTIVAKWTGVEFSNGIAGEFQNPYTVPFFGEDVPAYVDRTHQWNGATTALPIPNYLLGGEYIMIGNDNRDNASLQLEVYISEPALVYLLIDNRLTDGNAADPPEGGITPDGWSGMSWVYSENFTPVLNGLNRNNDPNIPDEIGVDEGGDGTGAGAGINNYASVYMKNAPAGKFTLYQPDNASRNMYGVVIKPLPTSISNPPTIEGLSPTNNALFYNAASGINFSAVTIAPNKIEATNISLVLNGTNVSAGLTVGGSSSKRTVAYTKLAADTIYRAQIIVTDQAGRGATNEINFDTFSATTTVTIETEDYNYDSGKYSDAGTAAGYANMVGVPEIDYHDGSVTVATQYRTADYVGLAAGTDSARQKFTGASDYMVNAFLAGDWMNYTRTFNNNTYNVYLRASSSAAQIVRLDRITGSAAANQTAFTLGMFVISGAAPFSYIPLVDASGKAVALSLSGVNTLRLTADYSPNPTLQLNYLLFVPVTTGVRTPYVSTAIPAANADLVSMDATVKATIVNGSAPIAANTVVLTFNGANVTSSASVSAASDGITVAYDPPGQMKANTKNSVILTYSDGSASYTNQWNFTTVPFKGIITSVVEYDGDDSANSPPQYTGQTFNHPNLGMITMGVYQEEAPAYRSRVHQWNGIATNMPLPSYLVGGEYIMAQQENRDNVPYQVDVKVSEAALVYVLVDNRLTDGDGATPPDFSTGNMQWLLDNGWTPVMNGLNRTKNANIPDEVGFDEGADGVGAGVALNQYASVYMKTVPAGTVSLYQADNSGNNMYGVVVVPVASHLFTPEVSISSPINNAVYSIAPTNITITAQAIVSNSTISKVEFFYAGTNKIGEATSAPYSVSWNNVTPMRYTITAKATAANEQTAVSKPVSIVVGKVISVNFQAATATTPEGYMADTGEVYADRGNGYSYGWDVDNTANSRERNSANSPDKRYDTFNHMQKALPAGRVWEIEVPNGRYLVYAVAGEASNYDSVYDIQAEGITVVSGTPNSNLLFIEDTGIVTVTDGKLTISNGPLASNNKICFVDLFPLPAEVAKPVMNKPSLSGKTFTITWTGGGKLQEASSVKGPWTDVAGNPKDTFSVQATESLKFYRVIVP